MFEIFPSPVISYSIQVRTCSVHTKYHYITAAKHLSSWKTMKSTWSSYRTEIWYRDFLGWKTTFHGRQPSMEDDLLWKKPFDGRWPSIEEDLGWKTAFDGRQPLMEDDLRLKMTFNGRQPSIEFDTEEPILVTYHHVDCWLGWIWW